MAKSKAADRRATVRLVNEALSQRGYEAMLVKAAGYFFFRGGEANAWLDRTVRVPRVGDLTIGEWVRAYQALKKKNAEIARSARVSARRT